MKKFILIITSFILLFTNQIFGKGENNMKIKINGHILAVELAENSTTDELKKILGNGNGNVKAEFYLD